METSGTDTEKAKRRIEVDVALKDIRSGMDDAFLMEKYRVSARGLQSLFSKLVRAGAIQLAELDQRMPAFMGTVFLPEEGLNGETGITGAEPPVSTVTGPSIDLDKALKDIREGMEDSDLMERYRLSSQGLGSLFDHLVSTGLITRKELDLRMPSVDSTVDLRGLISKMAQGKEATIVDEVANREPEDPRGCETGDSGEAECVDCEETASRFTEKLWPQG
jgi:hypothetical protein